MTHVLLPRHPDDVATSCPSPVTPLPVPAADRAPRHHRVLGVATGPAMAWAVRWWPALAGGLAVAVLLDLLVGGPAVDRLDLAARAWAASLPHSPAQVGAALVADHVGQRGIVTPVLVAGALWVHRRTRSWSSLALVLGTVVAMNAVLAAAKFGLSRGLAIHGDPSLFVAGGQAFPSGHAANAASTAALAVVLLTRGRRRRVRARHALAAVAAYSAVMGAVSLYLGFHWLSDLVVGALVGALVVRAGLEVERRWARRLARRDWAARRRQHRPATGSSLAPPAGRTAPLASAAGPRRARPAQAGGARAAEPARDRAADAQLRRGPGAPAA